MRAPIPQVQEQLVEDSHHYGMPFLSAVAQLNRSAFMAADLRCEDVFRQKRTTKNFELILMFAGFRGRRRGARVVSVFDGMRNFEAEMSKFTVLFRFRSGCHSLTFDEGFCDLGGGCNFWRSWCSFSTAW